MTETRNPVNFWDESQRSLTEYSREAVVAHPFLSEWYKGELLARMGEKPTSQEALEREFERAPVRLDPPDLADFDGVGCA